MNLAPNITLTGMPRTYSNGLQGIFETVAIMRHLVREYKINPEVRQAATGIIFLTPAKNEYAEASTLFNYVRDHVRYLRDIANVETIVTPDKTLLLQVGDCDDQSTLLAAMLESVGYETRFVVAGYNGANVEHVYLQVYVFGEWFNCDPTEPHEFGWSPPNPSIIYVERI